VKQFGKATIAVLMAAVTAMPCRSARRGCAREARSQIRSRRYRGVPTFADSTKADDGAYDDPIVREAAVSALGRYNGAVVAVRSETPAESSQL